MIKTKTMTFDLSLKKKTKRRDYNRWWCDGAAGERWLIILRVTIPIMWEPSSATPSGNGR